MLAVWHDDEDENRAILINELIVSPVSLKKWILSGVGLSHTYGGIDFGYTWAFRENLDLLRISDWIYFHSN